MKKNELTKKDRVEAALNHKEPDRPPIDIGGSPLTGIHVSNVYKLRQYFGLDNPGTPVRVFEPYQMLGEISEDLKDVIGSDVIFPDLGITTFGYPSIPEKEWELDDGTPVLVPELFNTERNSDGSLYQYPGGNKTVSPSAVMPKGGYFFDAIIRKKGIDDARLNPEDNLEEYTVLPDMAFDMLGNQIKDVYDNSSYAICTGTMGTSFGDIFNIPGVALEDPKGIRDIEEWYVSLHTRKEYIKKMFSGQLEVALANLDKMIAILKDIPLVVFISGTDFGMQNGLFISLETYRELFKPYYKAVNDRIHSHTKWKTFMHCCGSVIDLIPDIIDSGFDILNPVQISAKDMDPKKLKDAYGKDITFWGGGIDTQKTLPLGTPAEVKEETKRLIDIFSPGGGFVFAAVHNIQGNVPVQNIVAMIEALQDMR